jgi:hypothetical protein
MSNAAKEPSKFPNIDSHPEKPQILKGSINIGLVFIVLGILVLLVAAEETLLSCNRTDNNQVDCTIQSTLFGFIPKGSQQAYNVQSATVGEDCTSRGCTYRPELVTASGIVPLIASYSAGTSEKQGMVNQVNDFLKSSQSKSLATSYGLATYLFIIPLLLIAFGFYTLIVPVKTRRFRW